MAPSPSKKMVRGRGTRMMAIASQNTAMASLNIFLVDDHPLFRSGLRMVLQAGLGEHAIHEMASVEEALQATVVPDVLLLDIHLAGVDGLQGLGMLHQRWPEALTVVVSSDDAGEVVRRALAAGAHAFVSKAETPQHILQSIERVMADHGLSAPSGKVAVADTGESVVLTERQLQVLTLVAQGLSNRAIGQRLFLSEHTIRWHVQAILDIFRASSRSEAVFMARRDGLLP